MNHPYIAGLETEYGIVAKGCAALSLDDVCRIIVDSFARKSRAVPRFPADETVADCMLQNGARFYVDHGHPEYSTPECNSPMELIACDHAGDRVLLIAMAEAESRLPPHSQISIFKNNTDYKGHSYGSHENYLLSAALFESLIINRSPSLFEQMIPFLISRQIFAGAGKTGGEADSTIDFQVSQRADFFTEVIGPQTTFNRPIINTRDEPHADSTRFRRMHVIIGDSNRCDVAAVLKSGTMLLILRMLEEGAALPKFPLSDPVAALQVFSQDLAFSKAVNLIDGKKASALDIQRAFCDRAERFIEQNGCQSCDKWELETLRWWQFVLRYLPGDREKLLGKIDWVTKYFLLRRFVETNNEPWNSPLAREIDIQYHAVSAATSQFQLLQTTGIIQNIVSDEQISAYVNLPPLSTRAHARGEYIRTTGKTITEIDWETLQCGGKRIDFPDPGANATTTADTCDSLRRDSGTIQESATKGR